MFPDWTILIGFWLGAVTGSFLNVVIWRLPRAIPLGRPAHSFCPKCEHRLGPRALVPLLSWAWARGKCVYCGERVSGRYFLVELLTALVWAGIWKAYFVDAPGYDWLTPVAYGLASAALVAIVFIDWELYIIPDEINAFLLLVAVVFAVGSGRVVPALWGYLAGWGVLFGIALLGRLAFGKDAMGHGDIKMMRGVGALLGVELVLADLMIAVVLGLAFSLLILAWRTARPAAPEPELETEEEGEYEGPESVRDLLVLGVSYLLLFDVVALFWKGLYPRLGFQPEPESVEDDDWKPSLTTIPFGPYLAAGAIACVLAQGPILRAWDGYFGPLAGR